MPNFQSKRLINTILTLGSILIGLGILLFIASNWDKLGRPAKIAIIFSVITVFNLAGYYFRYVKKDFKGLAEGFLLIGAFSFGAGVWLIAQIFQIHYNFSAGIIFWLIGILPVAYIFRSWPVLSLASILSFIWLCSYFSYYESREAYGFFVLLAAIAGLSYSLKQRFPLFVMIVALGSWFAHFWILETSLFNSFSEGSILILHLLLVMIYLAYGFILYGLGSLHERDEKLSVFSFLYKDWGLLTISFSAYSLTYAHHYQKFSNIVSSVPVTFLIGILVIIAGLIIFSLKRFAKSNADITEIKFMGSLFACSFLAAMISLIYPQLTSLCFNLLLLGLSICFMYLGFIKRSEGIFRTGIIIFFLHVLSKYFDIFWKMMPKSLLFIFGGILLIAGAVFAEGKRKEIENRMRNVET